jgi:hypothetical protein
MNDAALLFVATFGVVFALGLQSLNVNGGHKAAAFCTSFLIGTSNLVLFKVLPGPTGTAEIAAYLLGGPFGIVASMLAHPYLARLTRGDWRVRLRLRIVSPRESEAQVAAAFAVADVHDESLVERLTPSPEVQRMWADTVPAPVPPEERLGELERGDLVTNALASIEHQALRQLAADLLNPDELGHAATPEVRNRARYALGKTHREAVHAG